MKQIWLSFRDFIRRWRYRRKLLQLAKLFEETAEAIERWQTAVIWRQWQEEMEAARKAKEQ